MTQCDINAASFPHKGFPFIDDEGRIFWKDDIGRLHNMHGPAFEDADGYAAWWIDGRRHREDHPALIHPDGRKEWWVNGEPRYDRD